MFVSMVNAFLCVLLRDGVQAVKPVSVYMPIAQSSVILTALVVHRSQQPACWRGPWVVRVPDPLIAGNNLYPPFPPLTSSSSKNKRRCCSTHGWPLPQIIALTSGTTANQLPQDIASVRPGCHVSILTSRQSGWSQGQQLFARDEHLWCRCQCHALKIQRVEGYKLRGYREGEVGVCQFRQSPEDRWTRLVAVRMRSTGVFLNFSGFISASSSSPLLQRSVNLTRSSLWCHLPSLSTNC